MELIAPIFALLLLAVAFFAGRVLESRHFQSLRQRELATLHAPAVTLRNLPEERAVREVRLVTGSVVVSVDYFKRFLAGFRMFFGGELRSYSSLLDRARREALLRMKESCPEAHIYINCRLETASISKGEQKRIGSVEVVAYGTAVVYADEIRAESAG
jgi:uncharacterized protein YbjQ (UPF0145 family)